MSNTLSVAEHVQAIIKACSQTLHALRVLRAHGMPAVAIHNVYRAVIFAKLCYASSAWWGFASADDRLRLGAFIRRSIRQNYCSSDLADLASSVDAADESLFQNILADSRHVLHTLLPDKVITHYNLRPRRHDRQLIPKENGLFQRNFIIRMLYKNSY